MKMFAYLSRNIVTIKEIAMNDTKVAIESHEERLTLNKSNAEVHDHVSGGASYLSYVFFQWKRANCIREVVQK